MSPSPQTYTAFGLRWRLPFACPEMGTPLEGEDADILVAFGSVPVELNGSTESGPYQQVQAKDVIFTFPGVGRYQVHAGRQIIIDREEGSSESDLRLFLLGTVASLILVQRGLLPIHASGIRTGNGAVLFAGHSGAGKSTLLATFVKRGYAMLTDDLAAIDLDEEGRAIVYPGFPQMKLWADSARQLQQPTEGLRRVRPALQKFAVPLDEKMDQGPVALRAIYLPVAHHEPSLRLETLSDARKFNTFLDHTWQKMTLKRIEFHGEHFRKVVAVANQVRVLRVYRPTSPFMTDELAELIEADFMA